MDVAAESPQRHHTHHRQRPQAAISPSRPVGGAPGPHRAKSPNRHHNQQRGAAEQRGRSRSPAKVHRTPSTHSGSASSVLSETNAHNEQRGRQHHGDVRSNTAASSPTKAKGKRSLSPLKRRKSHSKSMPAPESVQHAPAATNPRAIEEEFERMLTQREIPHELRATLHHLDVRMKENLVRNQAVFSLSSLGALAASQGGSRERKQSDRSRAASPVRALVGKSTSTVSLSVNEQEEQENILQPPDRRRLFSHHNGSASSGIRSSEDGGMALPSSEAAAPSSSSATSQSRTSRPRTTSHATTSTARNRSPSPRRPLLASNASSAAHPGYYAKHLLNTPSRLLDIDRLKKLRVMLSTESPAWLGDFLFTERGYEGLLKRVGELVEMEWREEIHDDKALHELLRSMSFLGDTDKGMLALSSLLFRPYTSQLHHGITASGSNSKLPTAAPAASIAKEETPPELAMGWECHPPFGPLVGMLLSERKPGDLTTRKLLIDVLALLPRMRLPSGLSHSVLKNLKASREISSSYDLFEELSPLSSHHMLFLLLHNPLQTRSLSLLPFIQQSHHTRPFKTYLREIEGVVRDYFWIFCHSRNRFWDWEMFGEEGRRKIEGPKVPGGMTGGVEFEAMAYVTANFKLLNNLAGSLAQISSREHPIAYSFHAALFDSGLERILSTLRRASQQYYSELHLAMARYISLCQQSGCRLPRGIDEWCDRPQGSASHWQPLEVTGLTSGRSTKDILDEEWQWEAKDEKREQARAPPSSSPFPSSPQRSRAASPTRPPKSASRSAAAAPTTGMTPATSTGHLSASSSSGSIFAPGTGRWLGKGQSAAAFLATTSASDQDFFNEPMKAAGGGGASAGVDPQRRGDAARNTAAMDVPLPASPVKGGAGLSSSPIKQAVAAAGTTATATHRSPWEAVQNPTVPGRPRSPQKASAASMRGNGSASASTSPSKRVQRGFDADANAAAMRQEVGGLSSRGQSHTARSTGSNPAAASNVVKIGTAKDRIKLWEGRMGGGM